MIKRDVLEKSGFNFAEHLRYGQDGYLWNKLAERFEIIAISKPLTKVRMREINAMLSARIQLKARALSLERIKTNYNSKRINNNIDGNIIRIYNMCFKLNNFLEKHIYILDISESISELIAKIVYFPLWRYVSK